MIRILIYTLLLLGPAVVHAQHGALVSQYMLNGLPLNPGFTGSRESLSATASYRTQWTGLAGAPVNQNFAIHSPLKNENLALGVLMYQDKIGVSKTLGVDANFAYRLPLSNGKLSFGISAGMRQSTDLWTQVETAEEDDNVFQQDVSKNLTPGAGFGVYYSNFKYYVSLSVPHLMTKKYAGGDSYRSAFDSDDLNVYLNSGCILPLTTSISLKPSFMMRYHTSGRTLVDLNLLGSFMNLVEAGVSYRHTESMVGIMRIIVNPQFSLGYSFDYSFTDLSTYHKGTHEITLKYDLNFETNAHNPRFF